MPVRVRFAPSPTGYLHIGGVRTALFNWLWARKNGGAFVLRVEDTDQERSTPESKAIILDAMRWLGLDWDEGPGVGGDFGPYEQMLRLALYKDHSERLIANGKAYRCYCTKEELDALRAALKARDPKATFKYPGTCRDRKDAPDKPFVVRFRTPADGVVTYVDKVFGEVTTPNAAQQDFVLVRSDGIPLYNFGAVVDDITMGITLVARGRDHMVNTPPQIMLYEAFGANVPEMAHLPMMLAPDGAKLGKRHGAVSATEYRDKGYAPDAVLNYLARFGWSHGDQEVFSKQQLIDAFDWSAVGRGDGKFDAKKFLAINYEHLKSDALVADAVYASACTRFVDVAPSEIERVLPAIRPRAHTFIEAAELMDFFFREPPTMDEAAAKKSLVRDAAPHLRGLLDLYRSAETWTEAALDAQTQEWLASRSLAIKDIAQALRVALTGRAASPALFQVLALLGKEKSLARLERAIARAEAA